MNPERGRKLRDRSLEFKPRQDISEREPRKGTETDVGESRERDSLQDFRTRTPKGDGNALPLESMEMFLVPISEHERGRKLNPSRYSQVRD